MFLNAIPWHKLIVETREGRVELEPPITGWKEIDPSAREGSEGNEELPNRVWRGTFPWKVLP